MSIIGTRPPLISETNFYELHHRARLAIKPGITGMWQVSGRSDITDFEEVVRLDKEYITDKKAQIKSDILPGAIGPIQLFNYDKNALMSAWGSEEDEETQKAGISLALCQTEKGKILLEHSDLRLLDVDLKRAIEYNHQLRHPSCMSFFGFFRMEILS